MKQRFRLTDVPLIIFGTSFVYFAVVFVFTGVNMLAKPDGDPSRWLVLLVLTGVSFFVWLFGRD